MNKSILLVFVSLVLGLTLGSSQAEGAKSEGKDVFLDNFKSSSAWEVIKGDWEVKNGVYHQQDNTAD